MKKTALLFLLSISAVAQGSVCSNNLNELLKGQSAAECHKTVSNCRVENLVKLVGSHGATIVELANIGKNLAANGRSAAGPITFNQRPETSEINYSLQLAQQALQHSQSIDKKILELAEICSSKK